jgi:hypothetical protein
MAEAARQHRCRTVTVACPLPVLAVDGAPEAAAITRAFAAEKFRRLRIFVEGATAADAVVVVRCPDAAIRCEMAVFALDVPVAPLTPAPVDDDGTLVACYPFAAFAVVVEGYTRATAAANDASLTDVRVLVDPPAATTVAALWGAADTPSAAVHLQLPSWVTLRPYQRRNVEAAVRWGGRAIFGDEMGTGKTLQALSTVAHLDGFPVLVVTPASTRPVWADETERWLRTDPRDVHAIDDHNTRLRRDAALPRVTITSYNMAVRLRTELRDRPFRTVIFDESHHLRVTSSHGESQRVECCRELAERAEHVLLLSGTPSLLRPFDLYHQVAMLRRDVLASDRFEFAADYCVLELAPFLRPARCHREAELHLLLRATVMTRSLKRDVLRRLPRKVREVRLVPLAAAPAPPAAGRGDDTPSQPPPPPPPPASAADGRASPPPTQRARGLAAMGGTFQTDYHRSGDAKVDGVAALVRELLSEEPAQRVVVFAHHHSVLAGLERRLAAAAVPLVRVDGTTPPQLKQRLLDSFNATSSPAGGDEAMQPTVALLGITACGVGVSLTGAATCVFAEVPPDVSWLQQGEDRLHRPGQRAPCVRVMVCLGVASEFDARHWAMLRRSYSAVRGVVDGPGDHSLQRVDEAGAPLPDEEGVENGAEDAATLAAALLPAVRYIVSPRTQRLHCYDLDGAPLPSVPRPRLDDLFAAGDVGDRRGIDRAVAYFAALRGLTPLQQRRQALLPSTTREVMAARAAPAAATSGLTRRYRPVWPAEPHGAVPAGCLHFGWRVAYQTHTVVYRALVCAVGPRRVALCLSCSSPLTTLALRISAGSVVDAPSDDVMFCSGECRGEFFVRRGGAAIRAQLGRLEHGVCRACGVDAERLVGDLAAVALADRAPLLQRRHPRLAALPALAAAIVQRPTAGAAWHADHVVPVCRGGGEASLHNLQTLCVACHHDKTATEQAGGWAADATDAPPSPAPRAWGDGSRVATRKRRLRK